MSDAKDGLDVGAGMVVMVERVGVAAAIGATSTQIVGGGKYCVVDVVDVFDAVGVTVEGVAVERGGQELHGPGGAGVGSAARGAGLPGFNVVHGG